MKALRERSVQLEELLCIWKPSEKYQEVAMGILLLLNPGKLSAT